MTSFVLTPSRPRRSFFPRMPPVPVVAAVAVTGVIFPPPAPPPPPPPLSSSPPPSAPPTPLPPLLVLLLALLLFVAQPSQAPSGVPKPHASHRHREFGCAFGGRTQVQAKTLGSAAIMHRSQSVCPSPRQSAQSRCNSQKSSSSTEVCARRPGRLRSMCAPTPGVRSTPRLFGKPVSLQKEGGTRGRAPGCFGCLHLPHHGQMWRWQT